MFSSELIAFGYSSQFLRKIGRNQFFVDQPFPHFFQFVAQQLISAKSACL